MSIKNDAGTRLVKNTIIYMIGNLGSKFLQMLILPLITSVLLTEEYGYYDLVITTISLITPIVTLQLIEAMFRYVFQGDEEEKKVTISSVVAFLLIGIIILALVIVIFAFLSDSIQYPFLIYLNYISSITFTFLQKLARCEQRNAQVATSGVLNTIVMLVAQVITLYIFKMRTDGMLIANCLSYFIATFYLNSHLHVERKISVKSINKKHCRELLKYSLPLVPNSVCWWFVSACDKYVISFFLSVSANGIYSIASKFSQLLTFVITVFQMAWQESSIIEADSETRNIFYTNTFNTYMRLLLSGYIILLPIIRIIMPYLVSSNYETGYLYNPLLLLGAVFSAFSQFYGSAYLAFKKTGGALSTTIIAAIINCFFAISLISKIDLFAPALGTCVAFLCQWIIRVYQMKDYFKVKIDKKTLMTLSIFAIITTALYYVNSIILQTVILMCASVLFIFYNKKIFSALISKIKRV